MHRAGDHLLSSGPANGTHALLVPPSVGAMLSVARTGIRGDRSAGGVHCAASGGALGIQRARIGAGDDASVRRGQSGSRLRDRTRSTMCLSPSQSRNDARIARQTRRRRCRAGRAGLCAESTGRGDLCAGQLQLLMGEPSTALASFDDALRVQPKLSPAYLLRAKAHLELGETRSATRDLDDFFAASASPDPVTAAAQRGHLLRIIASQLDSSGRDHAIKAGLAELTMATASTAHRPGVCRSWRSAGAGAEFPRCDNGIHPRDRARPRQSTGADQSRLAVGQPESRRRGAGGFRGGAEAVAWEQ